MKPLLTKEKIKDSFDLHQIYDTSIIRNYRYINPFTKLITPNKEYQRS